MEKLKDLGIILQCRGSSIDEILNKTTHKFVLDGDHLYFLSDGATGVEMSAREAYEKFGYKKLNELSWLGAVVVKKPKKRRKS